MTLFDVKAARAEIERRDRAIRANRAIPTAPISTTSTNSTPRAPGTSNPLDGDGLPSVPCRTCGGRLFWKAAELPPQGLGWRCERCDPRPADRLAHACALPPEERGRKLAEASLGRGIEGAKLWELAKLGAADLIAAELRNLARRSE